MPLQRRLRRFRVVRKRYEYRLAVGRIAPGACSQLYRDRFPSRTTVNLLWFLNEARQLERIRITDNETCL